MNSCEFAETRVSRSVCHILYKGAFCYREPVVLSQTWIVSETKELRRLCLPVGPLSLPAAFLTRSIEHACVGSVETLAALQPFAEEHVLGHTCLLGCLPGAGKTLTLGPGPWACGYETSPAGCEEHD